MNTDKPARHSPSQKTRVHELIFAKFGVQPSGCTAQAKGELRTSLRTRGERREKSFAGRKGFFSRNLRALRGFAVNPGLDFHREGAKENAKDFSLVAALLLCVHLCSSVVSFCALTVSSFRLRT